MLSGSVIKHVGVQKPRVCIYYQFVLGQIFEHFCTSVLITCGNEGWGGGGTYSVLRFRIVLRGLLADMFLSTLSQLTDAEIGSSL